MTAEQQEKIYLAFHSKVMGYLCARINRRAEAEDLCSEVFEKIFRRFDQYDKTKSSISTWVFTITTAGSSPRRSWTRIFRMIQKSTKDCCRTSRWKNWRQPCGACRRNCGT